MLRELGCHRAQGYYLSPAIAPAEFLAWLRAYHARTGTSSTHERPPTPAPAALHAV